MMSPRVREFVSPVYSKPLHTGYVHFDSICACAFKFHRDDGLLHTFAGGRKVRECYSALCSRLSGGGYLGKYGV